MISWIQRYFQKHFRLVFIVVLIAVALPMVVIYSSSGSGGGEGVSRLMERKFFNINLANQDQARRVFSDGELSAFLQEGYPYQGYQLQQYALQRVAGLALADELHLPAASPAEVEKYILTLRAFHNQQGQFDQSTYSRFADNLKVGGQLSGADVNRVLREDVRLEALAKVLGGPGYLLPADVKMQLGLIDSTWTVQVATLDYASFNPSIDASEEALKKFHEENAFRYDVPARPRLSYVEFKAADFVPPNAPTEAELRAFYNANAANFPVPPEADKKDAAAPVTETDNFPKVRAQVETAMRNAASRRLAAQVANNLTVALYERLATIKAASPELTAYLASQGGTAVPIAPFAPNQPPADKPWLGAYAEAISRLSRERYFSDPLPTPDGVVVLLWQESLPAYKPLLTELRDRVAADFRESEKRRLFVDRGNALKAQLQAAAKTPAGFAEKAASEKLEVKSYANFNLRQPPQDLPQPVVPSLLRLDVGQVSDLVGLGDKGLLVYIQEKKLPDLTPANPRYVEIQKELAERTSKSNGYAILAHMVEEESKKTEPLQAP